MKKALFKRQKTGSKKSKGEASDADILLTDIRKFLATKIPNRPEQQIAKDRIEDPSFGGSPVPERFTEIEVKIVELSSTGDGLGLSSQENFHVYVVPFSLPGDTVIAKVIHRFTEAQYSLADFVKVLVPASHRRDDLIRCQYFAKCSGCQFQMLPYADQLGHKKEIIEKAYRNFSTLIPGIVPRIAETIPSPLEYGYRTKLTPHFDMPRAASKKKGSLASSDCIGFHGVPPIGFMFKGTRRTIDIEDCPIGSDAVRAGMVRERKRISINIKTFERGATLLLRESTSKASRSPFLASSQSDKLESKSDNIKDLNKQELSSLAGVKTCVTDSNAISTEFVGDYVFDNPAGAFFQNNNSILPRFTAYVRDHIMPPANVGALPQVRYLIDAYCGSGLFTVTLSSLFSSSIGIDVDAKAIASAKHNAAQNKVSNASFIAADASTLFSQVKYPADETAVVFDPPRKGCDKSFLQQLLSFGPRRMVYVSCNVHTQARDVGFLVEGAGTTRYEIESLQGFDFFPQTGHVESVAVLRRSSRDQ